MKKSIIVSLCLFLIAIPVLANIDSITNLARESNKTVSSVSDSTEECSNSVILKSEHYESPKESNSANWGLWVTVSAAVIISIVALIIAICKTNERRTKKCAFFSFIKEHLLSLILGVISIAQASLIILVIIIVSLNHSKHDSFVKEYNDKESLFYTNLSEIDSLQNQSAIYSDYFSKASEKMVGFEAQIMKSNDFFTILLSLITLCATLAVVIPYIVGRAVSRNLIIKQEQKIKELEEQKENEYAVITKQGEQTLSKLRMAEAHLSRMTSYLLINPYMTKSDDEKLVDRMWAIGWAAKSLIRYFDEYKIKDLDESRYFDIEKFITYSSSYIVDSGTVLYYYTYDSSNDTKDKDIKGKVLRAFIDLFDAVKIAELDVKTTRLVKDDLRKTLSNLYKQAKTMNGEGETVIALQTKTKMRKVFNDDKAFIKWVAESLKIINDN